MSRSYRKSPISPLTKAVSEKEYKRSANRQKRKAVKNLMRQISVDPEVAEEVVLPAEKEFGDPWVGPKDGKMYFTPRERRGWWGELYAKLMRK